MHYLGALVIAVALIGGSEWFIDEDTVTMLVLLLASGFLGWLKPRLFALSGLIVGLVVPAVAVFSQSTGVHPAYETAREASAHGPSYAASLLILIAPALFAAFLGRTAARMTRTAVL